MDMGKPYKVEMTDKIYAHIFFEETAEILPTQAKIPGNHFQNAVSRCADGICWLLK